ncbi:MAG: AAA family ATPase, partial [Oligosphaeraceae bacterium]|nr:AAA family ATPase [Oligosphaeraceae bacterium]
MKDLTSSVYTFEDLINGHYLYVDKTEYIWNLVRPYKGIYFMSRPRRFGKSLTVSTLKAVFQGKKDLFKGLAIHDKAYDWQEYPVIHLDMANCDARTPLALRKYLVRGLAEQASSHHVSVAIHEDELAASFESLIRAIANAKDSPVVILLDEYDKPILNALMTPEATACRDVLKGFYSTIKKCESLERFVFVTGVTKFSHVSLFSDLNNLSDITMHADYATMLGYTQEEFEKYFAGRLDAAVDKLDVPREQLLAEIKAWYDGYRFEEHAETVYNPVSLAQCFINGCKLSNYWFSTGTPAFLMEVIRKTNFNFERALNEPVMGFAFNAFEIDRIDPLTLLLQTGYLTIKSSSVELGETLYYLDFPNREVKAAFKTY